MKKLTVLVVVALVGALGVQAVEISGRTPLPQAVAADACTPEAGATTPPASCPILPWLPGWRPQLGPVFNNPMGRKAAKSAIITRMVKAINHAPRGATIQVATYTFNLYSIRRALVKAYRRGVNVQMIVNGRLITSTGRSLQKVLGKNRRAKSFFIGCEGRCRKAGKDIGNLHIKVVAISRSGGARDLIMSTSGNLTTKAVYHQWNDGYAIANDTALWATWQRLFDQLRRERTVGPRHVTYNAYNDAYGYWFERKGSGQQVASRPATTTMTAPAARYRAAADHVVRRLKTVGCNAPAGYGRKGRTVIRIVMYAWYGTRGNAVAKQVAAKKRLGCDVKVIGSVIGRSTVKTLKSAGIPVRAADWMWAERIAAQEDGLGGWGPRFYSHLKVMMVNGRVEGDGTKTVWTGSENWSAAAFAADEMVLTVRDPAVYATYLKKWNSMWSGRPTHKTGVQPTTGP